MVSRGIATMGLDTGHCPPWLFKRMVALGREMIWAMRREYGADEFIKRIADPVWFQSFGTVLAFDWNSSGLTTILTAALKEAIRGREQELGIFICGGKGVTSRKTPEEIRRWGQILLMPESVSEKLVYSSKMAAKVDSSLVQDGYQIYHHAFFFSANGSWAVVQQGMNIHTQTARRYHWYSDKSRICTNENTAANDFDFIEEPHSGIVSQVLHVPTLNLTAQESSKNRTIALELVRGSYTSFMKDIRLLRKYSSTLSQMMRVQLKKQEFALLNLENKEFTNHPVEDEDFWQSPYLEKILARVVGQKPADYESFLAIEGVGPKTVRAVSLVAEVIYGAEPSYQDPARYSFAHGGKDATPYPVDRETYDKTISFFRNLVAKTHLPISEKRTIIQSIL
jgi:hypothetical protein